MSDDQNNPIKQDMQGSPQAVQATGHVTINQGQPTASDLKLRVNLPQHPVALVGRDDIVADLGEQLQQPQASSHMLVNGMGGVGKTAICRQLAHNACAGLNHIIWIDCENGIFEQLNAHVAPQLQINTQDPNWVYQLVERLNSLPPPNVMFLDNLESNHQDHK